MEDLKELAQEIEECKVSDTSATDKKNSSQQETNEEKKSKNQLKREQKQQKKQEQTQNGQKQQHVPNPAKQSKNQSERKKPIDQIKELNFVEIAKNGSEISIWHRPTPVHINLLKANLDVTLIVSLQGEREHVSEVQKACISNDVSWFNIPLEGANETLLSSMATRVMIQRKLIELRDLLQNTKQKAVLHCAAGIHRTGTITYSLLRLSGHTHETALEQLKIMREITFQQVGDHRIDIADRYFVKPVLEGKLDVEVVKENKPSDQSQSENQKAESDELNSSE